MKSKLLSILVILFLSNIANAQTKPNVLILYVDDLGFGDISYNGATQIATPNIDNLAKNGINFTNAHCTGSTCTPSRFSLLTGRYAWRKKNTNILPGDALLTIPINITTLPKVFQQAGYTTAVIGKWHLGLGDKAPLNWNKPITPGPNEIGFDYSFIFPATADRVPNVFFENHQVVGLDANDPIKVDYQKPIVGDITGKNHPELLKMKYDPKQGHDGHISNGISRIGFMTGGKSSEWVDEELAFTFNEKAVQFIDKSIQEEKPFFMYYAIHDIHVPRMPATMFKGKSKMGYRGDAILEMDYSVGYIINALKERGLLENTIIVFSSDNGPVLNDGYMDNSENTANDLKHTAGGIYRGGKFSIFEAGTRIPFIIQWPNHVKAGTNSDVLLSQVDLLASFADLTQVKLPEQEKMDSKNYLQTFLGRQQISRDRIVLQSNNQNALAIISNGWKYITPSNGHAFLSSVNIESGYSSQEQLYNLNKDPKEQQNLAQKELKKLKQLKNELQEFINEKITL